MHPQDPTLQVPSDTLEILRSDGTFNLQQLGTLCSRALKVGTPEAIHETMTRINKVLRGYGVSTLHRDRDTTGVALYVSRGNVLGITVFYHFNLKRFYVSTLYEWKDPQGIQ